MYEKGFTLYKSSVYLQQSNNKIQESILGQSYGWH
jgi:hypothetical protein